MTRIRKRFFIYFCKWPSFTKYFLWDRFSWYPLKRTSWFCKIVNKTDVHITTTSKSFYWRSSRKKTSRDRIYFFSGNNLNYYSEICNQNTYDGYLCAILQLSNRGSSRSILIKRNVCDMTSDSQTKILSLKIHLRKFKNKAHQSE